ncbi:MAG: FMN-binding protein [Acidobacteria bacterium]|nr:FMN-binding protein [Acidobacteriota bacterium]
MTDQHKPSLLRQVAPAAILTAAGVAFVSMLDNPTGTNTVSLDNAAAEDQATPVAPTTVTPTTVTPTSEVEQVTTTLAPLPTTTVAPAPTDAPVVESTGACDGDLVTSPTALFRWGGIQLQVHFTRTNAICDVEVLQYPNDRSKSIAINERALPVYNSEAVSANSAGISAVSGATDSWEAYTAALQAVIDSRS